MTANDDWTAQSNGQVMITVNAEGLQLPAEIVSRMLIEMSKKPSYRAAFRESLTTALLGEK